MDNLFKKKTIKPSTKLNAIKEGRLKKALKLNMRRRKNQSRVRSFQQETSLENKSK